jgi:hypothetical protein
MGDIDRRRLRDRLLGRKAYLLHVELIPAIDQHLWIKDEAD